MFSHTTNDHTTGISNRMAMKLVVECCCSQQKDKVQQQQSKEKQQQQRQQKHHDANADDVDVDVVDDANDNNHLLQLTKTNHIHIGEVRDDNYNTTSNNCNASTSTCSHWFCTSTCTGGDCRNQMRLSAITNYNCCRSNSNICNNDSTTTNMMENKKKGTCTVAPRQHIHRMVRMVPLLKDTMPMKVTMAMMTRMTRLMMLTMLMLCMCCWSNVTDAYRVGDVIGMDVVLISSNPNNNVYSSNTLYKEGLDVVRASKPVFGLSRTVHWKSYDHHSGNIVLPNIDTIVRNKLNYYISISFEDNLWIIPTIPLLRRQQQQLQHQQLQQQQESKQSMEKMDRIVISFVHSKHSGMIHSVRLVNVQYKNITDTSIPLRFNNDFIKIEYKWILEIEPNLHIGYTIMYLIVLISCIYFITVSCRCWSSDTDDDDNNNDEYDDDGRSRSDPLMMDRTTTSDSYDCYSNNNNRPPYTYNDPNPNPTNINNNNDMEYYTKKR